MISSEGLKKRERLSRPGDFRKAYKNGAHFAVGDKKSGAVILYILPNALRHNRIGFSISARNVRRATRRNRIRRLFKEAYRREKKGLKKGFDMVLVVKKDLGELLAYQNVQTSFSVLAEKAGLLTH